jgi:hypothetical protein
MEIVSYGQEQLLVEVMAGIHAVRDHRAVNVKVELGL